MNYREQRKLDRAMHKVEVFNQKKKNKSEYFKDYAKHHIAWIKELAYKYKERGVFPLMPTLISEYYSNRRDQEFALLIAACMKWDSENIYRQVQSVKKILGEQPYLWFRNQEYKSLGLPRNQDTKVEGYRRANYWKLSQFAQRIYELCYNGDGFLPFEEVFNKNYLPDVIENMIEDFDFGDRKFRGRMLDVVFRTADGIGKGLWSVPDGYKVLCPVNQEIKEFLATWVPEYKAYGRGANVYKSRGSDGSLFTFDEAVSFYEFEEESDFLYAFLGWQELCKRKPYECGVYIAKYQVWYNRGVYKKPYEWRNIQPEIDF